MRSQAWQSHDLPEGFVPELLVGGSEGLPVWGGRRGGRAVLAFGTYDNGVGLLTDLGEGELLTVASNGGNAVAVTSEGQVSWMLMSGVHDEIIDLESHSLRSYDPHETQPVAAWSSSADREFRVVLAFARDGGYELRLVSDQNSTYVPSENRLFASRDLDAVQVTAHQGLLFVAGPVSDSLDDARGCQVWSFHDPDFGGEWTRESLAPAPMVITDQRDGAVDYWWAGHDGQHVAVWHESHEVLVPVVAVSPHFSSVKLVAPPYGDRSLVLAIHDSSSDLYWQDDGAWVSAPLPPGRLRAGIRTSLLKPPNEGSVIPERVHLLVERSTFWMNWHDLVRCSSPL